MAALLLLSVLSRAVGATNFVDETSHVVSSYRLARDLVDARWPSLWTPELPCARARLHGPVQKLATAGQSPTIGMRLAEVEQFEFEKLPVYSSCKVHISRKWRFIYVRQPKSSSTAVISAIQSQLCGVTEDGQECDEDEFTLASAISDEEWRDFFVFTVVRNPWTRLLSAHTMFNAHFLFKREGENGHEQGEPCGNTFLEFSENTNSLRELCPLEQCCTYIPTMAQFVPHFIDLHINDQSHCVFLPGGESLVDFVGTTESIDEDWGAIVARINERAGTAFVAAPPSNPNGVGDAAAGGVENGCLSENARANFNETTLRNIARQYAMDVVRYGYL